MLGFIHQYTHCLQAPGYGDSGCCMEPSVYARRLLDMLNQTTTEVGWLGNRLMYDGWNAHPVLNSYYQSPLYQQTDTACWNSLTYDIQNFRMPNLTFSLGDSCGDSTSLRLNYTSNLHNQAYFGDILYFYNLKPVSHINCDTNAHYFNVSIAQKTYTGHVVYSSLTGYAPNWNLLDTCVADTLLLCDKSFSRSIVVDMEGPCKRQMEIYATYEAKRAYTSYIDSIKYDFKRKFRERCRETFMDEVFTLNKPVMEYHYTLYYYDQAGNLVQTVPPAGVTPITNLNLLNQIKANRASNTANQFPTHTMKTTYTFNTLNQSIKQNTPDGNESRFWYDELGRLVVSQNAEQLLHNDYSYTNFDSEGRIYEVGQLKTTSLMDWNVAINPGALTTFLNSGPRTEVTHTYYDAVKYTLSTSTFSQDNLRKRVASSTFEAVDDGDDYSYDQGTHYSYDIHGSVYSLVREIKALSSIDISQTYKQTDYEYDLVSGNVKRVLYQKDKEDQFIHKYRYDADNRITEAYTSTNNLHYDLEANYEYALHGVLQRTELGELKVQGIDNAYTLHGWLKSVNSNSLQSETDIGRDGDMSSINANVAKDVFGFSLGYYLGDYKPIGDHATGGQIVSSNNSIMPDPNYMLASHDLYNGNIRHMITAVKPLLTSNGSPQAMLYQYDQLNRISEVNAMDNAVMTNNEWDGASTIKDDYHSKYTYDANGNIMTLLRKGTTSNGKNINMDDFSYNYVANTNKLQYVIDPISNANYTQDIDNQSSNNYAYDEIGNLVKDNSEGITNIEWTVYGKIKAIHRAIGNPLPSLEFEYTPDGHRSMKRALYNNGAPYIKETYYIRDASGNIMATYFKNGGIQNGMGILDSFVWQSSSIYGSSRVGVYQANKILYENNMAVATLPADEKEHVRGVRRYELVNHLGNVLAVVSDKRMQVCNIQTGATHYEAEIITAQDYYPFGMIMPERTYSAPNQGYRYGFNGKEKDDEVKGAGNSLDFGARIYDGRLGRWLSLDPLQAKYPSMSPYNFVANMPIIAIDPDGKDYEIVIDKKAKTITIMATYYVNNRKTQQLTEDVVMSIMAENGKYRLKNENGDNYKIYFDLKVKYDTELNPKAYAEEDYKGNSIIEVNKEDYKGELKRNGMRDKEAKEYSETSRGITQYGERILSSEKSNTDKERKFVIKHEMFHTLGVDHPNGVGLKAATLNKTVIINILQNANKSKTKTGNSSIEIKNENGHTMAESETDSGHKPKVNVKSKTGEKVSLKGKIKKSK